MTWKCRKALVLFLPEALVSEGTHYSLLCIKFKHPILFMQIWARGQGGIHSPPEQLVFDLEDTFGSGSNVQTILFNREGEVRTKSCDRIKNEHLKFSFTFIGMFSKTLKQLAVNKANRKCWYVWLLEIENFFTGTHWNWTVLYEHFRAESNILIWVRRFVALETFQNGCLSIRSTITRNKMAIVAVFSKSAISWERWPSSIPT